MKTVKIAELKNRLSDDLRCVQRGESILVCDRDRASPGSTTSNPARPGPAMRRSGSTGWSAGASSVAARESQPVNGWPGGPHSDGTWWPRSSRNGRKAREVLGQFGGGPPARRV